MSGKPFARDFSNRAFGRELTPHEWGALVGAPKGATVNIEGRPNSVQVTTLSYDLNSVRTISIRNGRVHIHNDLFTTPKTGQGTGLAAFRRQVKAATKLGAEGYSTKAKRSNSLNGYYTWARLGYDAKIPAEFRPHVPASLSGARNVSDLMRTAEGRAAWKRYGVTTGMTFDLTRGSASRRALASYVREKRANR